MAIANSIHNGTPTSNIFKNESVLSLWYQAWLSQIISKGILKNSSGTIPYDVTREACCTSSKLEAYYILHGSDLVKAGISEYNTSYDNTV